MDLFRPVLDKKKDCVIFLKFDCPENNVNCPCKGFMVVKAAKNDKVQKVLNMAISQFQRK